LNWLDSPTAQALLAKGWTRDDLEPCDWILMDEPALGPNFDRCPRLAAVRFVAGGQLRATCRSHSWIAPHSVHDCRAVALTDLPYASDLDALTP